MNHSIHVLVVEDVEIAQKVARILLISLGCTVDVASDGETALAMAQQQQYDFILMDIGLPGMDGFSTTRAIRQGEGSNIHVPIIALTAHLDTSQKPLCLESGMDEFFNKPLTKEKAKTIINQFMPG